MRFWLSALLLLLSVSSFAATVKAVKYDGLMHISEAVANHLLTFKVGDELSEEAVDATLKVFFKQGYFEDIRVSEEEGVVTFHFKQKATISKVEMKGYKESDEEQQLSLLQIKKGSLYDRKRIEANKRLIIEALRQEGKIDSVVEVETEYLDNGSVAITFIVNEGENIIIEQLDYSGVEGLDPELFDTMIANKEHEFMGWFWGRNDGKMKLAELSYDPLRIRDLYMQHGYLDAKVDEPFVRVDFDHYTSQMSYQVIEGDVYRVSDIIISQEDEVIAEQALRDVIALKRNEPFNIKTFREDSERIKTRIADLGYAFVQVSPDLKKDKESKSVDVVYRIKPGSKVRIRNVVISGNSRTLDRIIRRELYLGPGDLYNMTDLKDSRNALGRTGYFESNTVEEKRIDNQTMDLVVKVKEAPTGNIQIGGGYGSYGGFMFNLGVSDRNIWGSGINIGINLERSETTESYSFNISNSRLNDSDFSGNFSIFKSAIKYNDYSVDTEGIGVGAGHRFSRHVSGSIGYNYSRNTYNDVNESVYTDDQQVFFESYAKSSVTLRASYDSTDDFYLPREGAAASVSFEKSGMGGDADFFKARTTFGKYNGLEEWVGFDLILRYKARYNHVVDTGLLPLAERFYMGGLGSVRGYESYSLSPRVTTSDGSERRTGAERTFSNSFELSFPLLPQAKMRLAAFLDWGFIGNSKLDEISRGGYGASLEWFSPVGPVNLVFARPLNEQSGDRTSFFEFSIGQRF